MKDMASIRKIRPDSALTACGSDRLEDGWLETTLSVFTADFVLLGKVKV
jgi:hypothetical protein